MIRRRRTRLDRSPSHERWLVPYADFVTLLFAFFTTMYAISTVDARKLEQMVAAFHEAFDSNGASGHRAGGPAPAAANPGTGAVPSPLADVRARLLRGLAAAIASGRVRVEEDKRGLVISVREAGSFATGRSELSDTARVLMEEAATALRGIPNAIRVEGHTDDVPIHTSRYGSNWELSTARATHLVAFFVEQAGIDPARLSAAGYGEHHPRVPNDSTTNRALNRRVDIVVLNAATAVAEEPSSPGAER